MVFEVAFFSGYKIRIMATLNVKKQNKGNSILPKVPRNSKIKEKNRPLIFIEFITKKNIMYR